MLALLVRLVYNMCVSKKETKEYPVKAPMKYQRKMKAIHPDITQEEIEHNFRIKKALDNDEVQAAVEDYVFWREAMEGVK